MLAMPGIEKAPRTALKLAPATTALASSSRMSQMKDAKIIAESGKVALFKNFTTPTDEGRK